MNTNKDTDIKTLDKLFTNIIYNIPLNLISNIENVLYYNNNIKHNIYDKILILYYINNKKFNILICSDSNNYYKNIIETTNPYKENIYEYKKYYYILLFNKNINNPIVSCNEYIHIKNNYIIPIHLMIKDYNHKNIINNITDNNINIINNILYGKCRDIIQQQCLYNNSKSIIEFIYPNSEFNNHNDIIIENIYDSELFYTHTGIQLPIDKYQEQTDIILVLSISNTIVSTLYHIFILFKFKYLKNAQFRRNLFEKFKTNLIYLNDNYCINLLNNSKLMSNIKIPYDTFYIHNSFSHLYPDKDLNINQYKFNELISNIIKLKQLNCNQFDNKYEFTNTITCDEICQLLWFYNYRCDKCGIEVCINYEEICTHKFSIDRINHTIGYTFNNSIITCYDCNSLNINNKYYNNDYTFLYNNIDKYNIKSCACKNNILYYVNNNFDY